MSTAAAAAAESLAARTRVLHLWAAAAQALADLKAPATVALAVPEVLEVLEALAAQVVLRRDLEAGKESASQRALLG